MADKKLLQVLIREIDAQLLEGVFAEVFKTENIKETD